MKKLFVFFFVLLIIDQAHGVWAHAVVTDYSFKMQALQANQSAIVELQFNSKIELGLSQIFLVSKGDKHDLLTITAGKKPGQLLATLPGLVLGDYALRLKVFAADGHLTEDLIHFTVGVSGVKAVPKIDRH